MLIKDFGRFMAAKTKHLVAMPFKNLSSNYSHKISFTSRRRWTH